MTSIGKAALGARTRIESVDVVRGFIMIVMALDHVRDFFGQVGFEPTDLDRTTIAWFFTRWITHFCAPVFFLLTGTGAYLSLKRKSKRELSRFLFTRGLWLIFLELTVLRCLGWQFNFNYHFTILMVLWALGWAMIVLSGLVYLPAWAVTAFGMILIAGHNLFDNVSWHNPVWTLLHSPGVLIANPNHTVVAFYVLVPWVGVTAAGYGLGQVYSWEPERRRAFLWKLGLGLIAAFVVIRGINLYGDPDHWAVQKSAVFTVLSFLNTSKYPPSLLYLMMTLGPATMFLWAVDARTPKWLGPALTVGKVPMFYYLLHIPLIHLIAVGVCYARYGTAHWMFESDHAWNFPVAVPPGWGYGLPVLYLVWFTVVLLLYPLCRWYAGVKMRSKNLLLSYI
jgi:uncharacterized membrane protein